MEAEILFFAPFLTLPLAYSREELSPYSLPRLLVSIRTRGSFEYPSGVLVIKCFLFLAFYFGGKTIDTMCPDSTINVSTIIADLKPFAVNCFYEMKVVAALYSDENDVAWLQTRRIARYKRNEVAVIDLATHRVSSGTDLNGLPSGKRFYGKLAQLIRITNGANGGR